MDKERQRKDKERQRKAQAKAEERQRKAQEKAEEIQRKAQAKAEEIERRVKAKAKRCKERQRERKAKMEENWKSHSRIIYGDIRGKNVTLGGRMTSSNCSQTTEFNNINATGDVVIDFSMTNCYSSGGK